jgi:Tfp pilus assembly protein PilO
MKLSVQRSAAQAGGVGALLVWTLRMYARRLGRHYGAWGWINFALLAALLAGGIWLLWHSEVLAKKQRELVTLEATKGRRDGAANVPSVATTSAARGDLKAFDEQLLAHQSLPQAIQDLMRSAEDQGLLFEQGNYDTLVETQGGFVRLRMNLPVKGSTQAVHRFIRNALLQQPQLALEGIRFKREGVQTGTIEAQLNWVLFARLAERSVPGAQPVRREQGEGP